jgi:hypothetical protein
VCSLCREPLCVECRSLSGDCKAQDVRVMAREVGSPAAVFPELEAERSRRGHRENDANARELTRSTSKVFRCLQDLCHQSN